MNRPTTVLDRSPIARKIAPGPAANLTPATRQPSTAFTRPGRATPVRQRAGIVGRQNPYFPRSPQDEPSGGRVVWRNPPARNRMPRTAIHPATHGATRAVPASRAFERPAMAPKRNHADRVSRDRRVGRLSKPETGSSAPGRPNLRPRRRRACARPRQPPSCRSPASPATRVPEWPAAGWRRNCRCPARRSRPGRSRRSSRPRC